MLWKFWKTGEERAAGPKELLGDMGRHLVVKLKYDPDWVWTLRVVMRPREGEKNRVDFRIFDPVQATLNSVKVQTYASLDSHAHLILFDGWYRKSDRILDLIDHYQRFKKEKAG